MTAQVTLQDPEYRVWQSPAWPPDSDRLRLPVGIGPGDVPLFADDVVAARAALEFHDDGVLFDSQHRTRDRAPQTHRERQRPLDFRGHGELASAGDDAQAA